MKIYNDLAGVNNYRPHFHGKCRISKVLGKCYLPLQKFSIQSSMLAQPQRFGTRTEISFSWFEGKCNLPLQIILLNLVIFAQYRMLETSAGATSFFWQPELKQIMKRVL